MTYTWRTTDMFQPCDKVKLQLNIPLGFAFVSASATRIISTLSWMGCLPVHRRVIPSIEFPDTYLNTWEIHYSLGVVSMVTTQCQIWTIQSVSTSFWIPTLDPRFLYTYISMLSYFSKLAVKWSSHETKIIVSSICPGWWSVFKGTFTNCFSFAGNVLAKMVFFFWTDLLYCSNFQADMDVWRQKDNVVWINLK